MSVCTICEEPLAADAKSCPQCGTVVEAYSSGSAESQSDSSLEGAPSPDAPAVELNVVVDDAESVSPGGTRQCPSCGQTYGPEFRDDYCDCGTELKSSGSASVSPTNAPPAPANDAHSVGPIRPPSGTTCLVVYSPDKQPLGYHTLDCDVTMVGRCDPIRGDFPDLDLASLFDEATAKSISRKHALVLRSRETGNFSLRPMNGNTGTQIEREMATELVDHPLTNGTRIILGGVVRIKFEVIQ